MYFRERNYDNNASTYFVLFFLRKTCAHISTVRTRFLENFNRAFSAKKCRVLHNVMVTNTVVDTILRFYGKLNTVLSDVFRSGTSL